MIRTPNEQQKKVIDELQANIILFASAGTGKTFTVANRISNILSLGKAEPSQILCLTFTIKACKELEEDVLGYVGEAGKEVCIKTIHSFCYTLLLEESKRLGNRYADLSVCDEVDQEEILKNLLSSRYGYWKLEENLKEYGLETPNFEACELCKIKGKDEVYFLHGDKLLSLDGEVYDIPQNAELIVPDVVCSACNETYTLTARTCPHCGHEIQAGLSKAKFEIFGKRTALRNFVSSIKHYREKLHFYSDDEIYDNQRTFDYIKEEDPAVYEGLISYYARYIGSTPDEVFASAMDRFAGRWIAEYDEYLSLSNLVDFDDLIIKANSLLSSKDGLSRWATRYKYIIVDEMQDTSVLEYTVLRKIFAQNNVMLCGDFFQTIYEWRGSNPEQVLGDYIKEFFAKIFMFSENYRATKTLAEATFGYLKNTYPDFIGKYCPEELRINSDANGEPISCYAFSNREEEAWQIYNYIQKNRPQKATDVCIMARSNKYIAELAEYFEYFNKEKEEEEQIRFFTVEENFNFFKKTVIKDALAVLKLLVNPYDRLSLERLTEKFVKGVGAKTIETLRSYNEIGVSILSFIDPQTHVFGDPYKHLLDAFHGDNLVVYDTETTGLDLSKDEIVQLSAIKMNADGKIIDTLDLMVEPSVEISKAAQETHGFDLEYIQGHGGIDAKSALEQFSSFVEGCVLVGHNSAAYDKPLVSRQLKDNALPALDILAEYDTLVIAKQFYPHLENYKLSTLCETFGIINECAHNALGDITATGQCLVQMLKEKIIPTTLERQSIIAKHIAKFEKIHAFMEEMRLRLKNGEALGAYIVERLGLKKKYPTNADWTAIRDLIQSLLPVQTEGEGFLKEYLRDAALSGSQMDILIQKLNRIPIITVHQAKGCEFDTVILAGADDNHFPSFAARQSDNEEEEKKVFYVAITRAKRRLILTRSMRNGKYEVHETPYFWLIPSEYVKQNHAWKNGN